MIQVLNFFKERVVNFVVLKGVIEDGNMDDFEAAYNFFRSLYKKVEREDIQEFEAKYKNS